MPSTITRQLLADKVDARLKLILTGSGYYTDLGLHVFERDNTKKESAELPGINWQEEDEDQLPQTEAEELTLHRLPIRISFAFKGVVTTSDARKAIADIEKAVKVDPLWDELAERTVPSGSGLTRDEQGNVVTGGWVRIIIEYLTEIFSET